MLVATTDDVEYDVNDCGTTAELVGDTSCKRRNKAEPLRENMETSIQNRVKLIYLKRTKKLENRVPI